ncbi:MAG: VCBS repeat-containing protein [Verrucomicrobia subdivision 3 bacterium]|nr:VCBS repeat-containing protein [Limisphaerales bacterium]
MPIRLRKRLLPVPQSLVRASGACLFGLCFAVCAAAALDWQAGTGFRSAPVTVPAGGKTGFTRLEAAQTGVNFSNLLSDVTAAANRIYENGSGVALGDIDGDGWCDIYFCRLEGANVLYRNRGNWRFEDVTAKAGVACHNQFSTGAVFADVDGDRDVDLFVNAIGAGTRLFLNDGRGNFAEARNAGLDRTLGSTSLALADFEGDGDLDLYVANYRTTTIKDSPPGVNPEARNVNGKIVVTPADRFTAIKPKEGGVILLEMGEPDIFYLNDGRGRFTPVSWTGGTFVDEDGKVLPEPPRNWGLSVVFRDFNGDGTPDLYLCNDFFYSPDQLWLNEGGKRFRAAPRLAWRNMSMSSMAADVADINRDGHDDFFVAEMLSRDHGARHRQRANAQRVKEFNPPFNDAEFRPEFLRNTLYLNRGDNTYAEIAQFSGVAASEWTWSTIFLDVDLDGYEDLLITNGNLHDVLDADTLRAIAAPGAETGAARHLKNLLKFPRIEAENLCFRNRGDLTFEEVSAAWGFNTRGISHGMALADLDQDGDQDIVVNNLNQAAGLYRNDSTAPRVAVRLKGKPPNHQGSGASLRLSGGPMPQTQSIMCGSRYLSGDEPMRVFATGALSNVMTLEVTWRSGRRSLITNVLANRVYEVEEAVEPLNRESLNRINDLTTQRFNDSTNQVLFEDVSRLISHTHVEAPFDDLAHQPLLPRKLGKLGPGIAWFDADRNGWDDLIVGTGKGRRLAIFTNTASGGFAAFETNTLTPVEVRDLTGIVGWRKEDGQTMILAGSSNYEDATTNGAMMRIFDIGGSTVADGFRARTSAAGPLAMADIDNDGDLDLFLGGRVLPRGYPEPISSVMFRNEAGRFRPDAANSKVLTRVGMVSGAVFSDLDGDGDADLVLACEWAPVRLLRNDGGTFQDITDSAGLGSFSGWWNGVTTGDFDGDGRLDVVASNWGRNTKYQAYRAQPLRVYWGDFSQVGGFDVFEAYYDPALKKVVPWAAMDLVATVMPFVKERFTSNRAYGAAGVEEILGSRLNTARQVQATTLESMLFLNRGERFEPRPLPAEAQFAPAFGLAVADADGDGNEDLFLSQNFFDVEPETSRYDAGRGLWLQGDGRGEFIPISGDRSGVKIYGQQRGAALSDFDGDGRIDLAVTQNGGETKLYRNTGARPGLRVRLNGPGGNPFAVGATLRVQRESRAGPVREIHAGSGYWSQDSTVQVMAQPEPGSRLIVRWPGGRTTSVEVPVKAREIVVGMSGLEKTVE